MPNKPYGIICPLSKACEYLEPRWTIQILGELWGGSSRFNDIRRGLGHMSPALLSRRLREMEAMGLVDRVEDRAAGTVDYFRTAKAIALEPALDALAHWAQRNIEAEIAIGEPNVSTMMWGARRYVKVQELPPRRIVMRFHFGTVERGSDRYWLVTQPGSEVDLCTTDPGTEVDIYVEVTTVSMAAIMLGRSSIAREIDEGRLFLSGDPRLIRTIDRWFPKEDGHDIDGVLPLLPDRDRHAGRHAAAVRQ
ncbi:helix-turn-helix domain-containing protein [Frigidibacter sp. RF13]|uniref:winged helix-turn-helix transcriptional regulator n=1 Tax=Frigidibacter sp. RF13 TaxID=2997340 RepID=UPI00226DF1E6|nr:helix-turn-helix domain-containing protein [Frigidibacter sp. RF13]MCY1127149.1 helix-turn-helix domain-containing protein [Frigidibacter sp. RF13]